MGSIEEADRIAPVKAINVANASEADQRKQKTESVVSVESVKSVESVESIESVKSNESADSDESVDEERFSDAQVVSDWVGYDFENQQTRSQLALVDELQRLGVSNYLNLPQLVVMGEQSVGKSSVLQAITDVPFPIDDGMCTRFATEIILKRTKPGTITTIHVRIIPDPKVDFDQKQMLEKWRPEGLDCTAPLSKEIMKDIFLQAQDVIFSKPISSIISPSRRNRTATLDSTNRLSSSTLQITRSGPRETNFAIVDIPGLVREQSRFRNTGQGKDRQSEHETATHLVKRYLDNRRSIVVVVIDVVDLERHAIFDLIRDLPDKESRVIGVINKCDTKQKQAADWVFDLIRNANPKSSLQYLKEGWYGLRNRAASEALVSDEERDRLEKAFFEGDEWKSLNNKRLGRNHLKNALIEMRNKHIKKSIPDLLAEIDKELDACVGRIEQLGEPRNTSTAQFAMISKIATRYSEMACGAVDGHYKRLRGPDMYARKLIRDNLDVFQGCMRHEGVQKQFRTCGEDANLLKDIDQGKWSATLFSVPIYAWIREAIQAYRAMEDGDEVNPEVKGHLWKQQITSWTSISTDSLTTIEMTVDSVNQALFAAACPDKDQRAKLLLWLDDDFRAASTAAKDELKRLVEDENGSVMTYNPLRVENQSAFRIRRTEAIKNELIAKHPELGLMQTSTPAMNINPINAELVINSLLYRDPELIGILNTHDSIAAYYDIALNRFVDNFAFQVIERHLLGPSGPLRLFNSDFITKRLHGEANAHVLNALAGEEPEVAKEREALEEKRKSLEQARKTAQGLKML